MNSIYKCLSCGQTVPAEEIGSGRNVAKCSKCGRDMYRIDETDAAASNRLALRGGTNIQRRPVIPSRYSGAVQPGTVGIDYDEDDVNPVILPHTPFVVILGFIFSFIFPIAGIIISIIGLRLVNQGPKEIRGRGLAIAGIVIGCVLQALIIILLALAPPAME